MTDLDFDELDRAVSSALGGTAKVEATPAATATTPVATSAPAISVHSTTTMSVPPSNTAAPAARRSSGRFMDVVHPSSDMRPGSSTPSPSRAVAPEAHTESTVPPRVEPEPISSTELDDHSSQWPDPIDFQGFKMDDTPDSPKPTAPQVKEEAKPEEGDTLATEPLNSPFIADAKVEKRPLGAFSETKPEVPPLDLTSALSDDPKPQADKPIGESTDHPVGTETPLPAELQDDLLSIESDPSDAEMSPTEIPATVGITPEVKPETKDKDEPTPPMPSIVQQYKERASTTNQPSGAIFDTENYHKPLAHPAKKKSGLVIVLWIVGLIVVGGGIGALAYYVVLPLL